MYKNKYIKYKNKYLKLQNKVNLYTIRGGTERITTYTGLFTRDITDILEITPDTISENVNTIYNNVNSILKQINIDINILKKNDKIIDYILIEAKKKNISCNIHPIDESNINVQAFRQVIDDICKDKSDTTNDNEIYDDIFNENTIKKIITNKIIIYILSEYYKIINNSFIIYITTNLNTFYNKIIEESLIIDKHIDTKIVNHISNGSYRGSLYHHDAHKINPTSKGAFYSKLDANLRNNRNLNISDSDNKYDNIITNKYKYFNDNDDNITNKFKYNIDMLHVYGEDDTINMIDNIFKYDKMYIDIINNIMDIIKTTLQYKDYIKYIKTIINHVYYIICDNNDIDYTNIITKFTMDYDHNDITYTYIDSHPLDITSHFINNHIKIHKYILNMINQKVCTDLYKSVCIKYFNIFQNNQNKNLCILQYVYMTILDPRRIVHKPTNFSYLNNVITTLNLQTQIIPLINPAIDKLKNVLTKINKELLNFYQPDNPDKESNNYNNTITDTIYTKLIYDKYKHYNNYYTKITQYLDSDYRDNEPIYYYIIYNILFKFLCVIKVPDDFIKVDKNIYDNKIIDKNVWDIYTFTDDKNPDENDNINNYLSNIFGDINLNLNNSSVNVHCNTNTFNIKLSSTSLNKLQDNNFTITNTYNNNNIKFIYMFYIINIIKNERFDDKKKKIISKLYDIINKIIYTLTIYNKFINRYKNQINFIDNAKYNSENSKITLQINNIETLIHILTIMKDTKSYKLVRNYEPQYSIEINKTDAYNIYLNYYTSYTDISIIENFHKKHHHYNNSRYGNLFNVNKYMELLPALLTNQFKFIEDAKKLTIKIIINWCLILSSDSITISNITTLISDITTHIQLIKNRSTTVPPQHDAYYILNNIIQLFNSIEHFILSVIHNNFQYYKNFTIGIDEYIYKFFTETQLCINSELESSNFITKYNSTITDQTNDQKTLCTSILELTSAILETM